MGKKDETTNECGEDNIIVCHNNRAFHFKGKYRDDLETRDYKCYETDDGEIFSFKKELIEFIVENPTKLSVELVKKMFEQN